MKKIKIIAALAVALASLLAQAEMVINEVCYDNTKVKDETGMAGSDWIELYNPGPNSVNLLNYGLGDANPYDEAKGVRLPSYTVPAGGFLVVFASADIPEHTAWTNAPNLAVIPANSTWRTLSPSGEPAATWKDRTFDDVTWAQGLSPLGYNDPKENMDCATAIGYGGNPEDRYPAAYFRKAFNILKPSVVTGLVVHARINDGMVVYLNGTEVLRQNMPDGAVTRTTLASTNTSSTQWTTVVLPSGGLVQGANVVAVEVHQSTVTSADLIMDMTVTALVNEQVPIIHGQFGLSKVGEKVHLFNAVGRIHEYDAPLSEIGENKTYGLAVDGIKSTYKVYDRPTPGLPNNTYAQIFQETLTAQKPVFSVPAGVYESAQTVTLSTPAGGLKIYYTLDGSDPRYATSYVFSGNAITLDAVAPETSGLAWLRTNPVEVSNSVPGTAWQPPVGAVSKAVVLRAIAVDTFDQKLCSPETRGSYFIGPTFTDHALPIVSLITDTNNLFGFTSGIYVPGKQYADSPEGYGGNKWGKPYANYHQDSDSLKWERPSYLELFEPAQTTASVAQMLGTTMHGGGTRAIPQKTLYLLARQDEYGAERVNYKLFPDEAATSYKRFLLRNSGNDWYGPDTGVATMLKDAVFHRLVKGLDISVMAYRPATVYINGEYWGLHNLRESFDKHYLATRYGLEADNMDILMHEEDSLEPGKVKITRIDGDKTADEDYETLINWVKANPLLDESTNYATFQTWVDVTNYTDYIVAETFFANTDWPINNCDFWRAHTNQVATCGKYGDQRWRWMLYDLDLAGDKGPDFNMFKYLSSSDLNGGREPGFLIGALWKNREFRNYFTTRYANLLNTTFRPERTAGLVAEAAQVIAPEIETHFRRWGRTTTQAQWQASVNSALTAYASARHAATWSQLDDYFKLGGTSTLTVRNDDASGTGGHFIVNGLSIDTSTAGVTNRAAWIGTFFHNLPVQVQAVPDPGYVFDGWEGLGVTNASLGWLLTNAAETVVARFLPNGSPVCTVTFDAQGGSVTPADKRVTQGSVYWTLPVPTREGYTFGGWRTGADGAGTEVTETTLVTTDADHSLYAKWTANLYTVTFDAQAGAVLPPSMIVAFGYAYGGLPVPTRGGYTFGGWWTGVDGAGTEVTGTLMVTVAANHSLFAKWNVASYTVTFDAQGGAVSPANKRVTFGAAYGALPAPTRGGYTFGGWRTGAGAAGVVITEAGMVTAISDHTLYAAWIAISPPPPPPAPEPYICPPASDVELKTVGSYDGYFYASEEFGTAGGFTSVRGTLSLKVTALTGKLTAKAVLQRSALSFAAAAWKVVDSDGTAQVTLTAKSGETLELFVRQNRIWGTLAKGTLGSATLTLDGARNRFADRKDTAAQALLKNYLGYYTVALPVAEAYSLGAAEAAPQGTGYLTLTVGSGGSAKVAGVLADGTKVSQASRLILFDACGPEACVPLFLPLYAKTGWVGGLLWLAPAHGPVVTDRELGWYVRWEKPGTGLDGFGELLDADGGFYGTSAALAAGYLFSADAGGVPYHYVGGTAEAAAAALPEGIAVTAAGGRMTMAKGVKPALITGEGYDYTGVNSSLATLTFTVKTGLFKGKFNLYYDDELNGKLTHTIVSVPYAGVLTPVRSEVFTGRPAGQGYGLVQDSDPAVKALRLQRSVPVRLEAQP